MAALNKSSTQTVRECDPQMVDEKRLIQRAVGIKMTMVNGQTLIENGEHTGAFPRRVPGSRNGRAST
jgi:hypothetical protein